MLAAMTKTLAALLLSTSLLACTDDAEPQPEALALPGSAYYPESLTADAHGTLYVGSLTTGEVVAFDDGNPAPRTILAAGTVTGETGVLVHDNDLWLCAIDATFQHPTQIEQFGLDGTAKASYTLDASQFCTDVAFAAAGTPLATELDQPTGVVQARGHAWVSEGQLGRLFAQPAQAPNLPFSVRRVD